MKRFIFLPLLAIFALTAPLFAFDPHDAKTVTVRNYSSTSTTTPATVTITSLTTTAVNSGTNSYLITADLSGYEVPSGGAVTFQIAYDGTAIADSLVKVSTTGHVTITLTKESVVAAKVIALQAVVTGGSTSYPLPVKVGKATLTMLGVAGATQ